MNNPTNTSDKEFLILCQTGTNCEALTRTLESSGHKGIVFNDRAKAMDHMRTTTPTVIIVQDSGPGDDSASEFIKEALKISWTIDSIVVSNDTPDSIHDRFEGLGVLGSAESFDDVNGFMKLLS